MTTINDLLRDKSSDIWTVGPDESVYDALQLMADKNIGAVLVMDSGRLVGLLSERDYARKLVLENRSSRETPVRDVMTQRVAYVSPSQEIEGCLALMTDKRFRHLPVMDNDKLVGLVSIGDLVKGVIADKEFMIEQLEQYITGQ
ncbi:CBS domain-containing protein [Salinisphaera hydrothermalis]|uniref:CBS domain containing membrane protein n=1 Tax=Salinisphaera hydrothermalis (strain C41B8) TaxID=1304275 RepID=A0A084INH0_SALHC|nr:CBS domain-containing protein [Salinisphaera hydrothermalis]KEZ78254.1 CBS domain containing membrane protein [Salinisphaera hydrothermalis C41B8]